MFGNLKAYCDNRFKLSLKDYFLNFFFSFFCRCQQKKDNILLKKSVEIGYLKKPFEIFLSLEHAIVKGHSQCKMKLKLAYMYVYHFVNYEIITYAIIFRLKLYDN